MPNAVRGPAGGSSFERASGRLLNGTGLRVSTIRQSQCSALKACVQQCRNPDAHLVLLHEQTSLKHEDRSKCQCWHGNRRQGLRRRLRSPCMLVQHRLVLEDAYYRVPHYFSWTFLALLKENTTHASAASFSLSRLDLRCGPVVYALSLLI